MSQTKQKGNNSVNNTKDLIDFQDAVFQIDSTQDSSKMPNFQNKIRKEKIEMNKTKEEVDYETLSKDLNNFNSWNYIIKKGTLKRISSEIEKSPFARRSESAPSRARKYEIEYHPQLRRMLGKWKKRFNKFKTKKKNKIVKTKLGRTSLKKLAFIKRRKNDELSILDIDHLVQRNICKDDLFVPYSKQQENSAKLVIKLSKCGGSFGVKEECKANLSSLGNLKDSNLLENINNYNDYSMFFDKLSRSNKRKEGFKFENEPNMMSKLINLFSSCSKKQKQKKQEISQKDQMESSISKIIYEFGIQKEKTEIKLHLLRVRFKDDRNKIVMM
jgi:hypothetical protein